MSSGFDPYHKWLGIPPKDQPPHLYRLLGIDAFESDLDVIDIAADQRIRALRGFQSGPHGAESQKLLNEVASARLLLLDPDRKDQYDRELRQMLVLQPMVPVAPQPMLPVPQAPVMIPVPMPQMPLRMPSAPPPSEAPPLVQPQPAPSPEPIEPAPAIRSNKLRRKRNSQADLTKHVGAAVAGVVIGIIALGFLNENLDFLGIAATVRGSKDPVDHERKPKLPKHKGSTTPNLPRAGKSPEKPPLPPMPEVVQQRPMPEQPPTPGEVAEVPDQAALAAAKSKFAGLVSTSDATKIARAAKQEKGANLYVLLVAARDKAAAAGEITESLNYSTELARAFSVDSFDLMTETLHKLAASCETPTATRKLTELALAHFDQGVQLQKTDALLPLAELAVASARKTDDAYLQKQATLKALDAQMSSK